MQPPPLLVNAEIVRALRIGRGWSVRDLALRSGIDKSIIYRLEKGSTTKPYMSTLRPLAAALRVEIAALLLEDAA